LTSGADIAPAAAAAAGVAAVLSKPVRRSRLLETLLRVVAAGTSDGGGEAAKRAPATRPQAAGALEHPAGPRILVVDDAAINRQLAARMLESLGYWAEVAGGGREGLKRLQRARYAAVLLDCQMPDLDGFALTAELRRRDSPVPEADSERAAGGGRLRRTVLDPAALRLARRVQRPGQPDVVAQLVGVFAASTPPLLAELRAGVARQDASALRAAAHTLKGSAAAVGAREMQGLCERLEQLGQGGSVVGAAELAERLEDAYRRARAALETLVPGGGQTCES
jgi:CheY-like chemotaxis protein/HPt (histidine-containing phosphotransfer) domain-containing protein